MMPIKTTIWRQVSRKTLINGFFITVSRFANYGLLFIFTMLNARTLGVDDYGRLAYYLAVTGIMAIFFTLGMDIYIVIQIAKDRRQSNHYLNANFINRTLLMLLVTIILVGLNCFVKVIDLNLVFIILYLSMIFDSYRTVTNGFFQAIEEMHHIAVFDLLRSVTLIVVFLILRARGLTLTGVALAYFISSLAAFFPGLALIVKRYQFRFELVDLDSLKQLAINSLPFFVNAIVNVLAMKVDLLMINHYMGNIETGYYNGAKRIYETTLMLPNIMTTVFLPKLSSGGITKRKQQILLAVILMVGLLVGLIFYFSADSLVGVLFGAQFKAAGRLLQILTIGIPPVFLSYFYGSYFAAVGERKKLVLINIGGTLFNMALNLIFIPMNQAWGAAWVATVSALFIFSLNFYCYQKIQRVTGRLLAVNEK